MFGKHFDIDFGKENPVHPLPYKEKTMGLINKTVAVMTGTTTAPKTPFALYSRETTTL